MTKTDSVELVGSAGMVRSAVNFPASLIGVAGTVVSAASGGENGIVRHFYG